MNIEKDSNDSVYVENISGENNEKKHPPHIENYVKHIFKKGDSRIRVYTREYIFKYKKTFHDVPKKVNGSFNRSQKTRLPKLILEHRIKRYNSDAKKKRIQNLSLERAIPWTRKKFLKNFKFITRMVPYLYREAHKRLSTKYQKNYKYTFFKYFSAYFDITPYCVVYKKSQFYDQRGFCKNKVESLRYLKKMISRHEEKKKLVFNKRYCYRNGILQDYIQNNYLILRKIFDGEKPSDFHYRDHLGRLVSGESEKHPGYSIVYAAHNEIEEKFSVVGYKFRMNFTQIIKKFIVANLGKEVDLYFTAYDRYLVLGSGIRLVFIKTTCNADLNRFILMIKKIIKVKKLRILYLGFAVGNFNDYLKSEFKKQMTEQKIKLKQ